MNLSQLKVLRIAVRLVLALGVAASVAANILHANPNPISQTIAAWPSLAFLLTVELTSRIPVTRRLRAAVRIAATVVIASIAGWISYWHMADVASRYGETGSSPYLLPFTVDGLIVVASVSLVELAVKIEALMAPVQQVVDVKVEPAPVAPAPVLPVAPVSPAVSVAPPAVVASVEAPLAAVTTAPRVRAKGRSGPQVTGPSNLGLNGRPLMEDVPQV